MKKWLYNNSLSVVFLLLFLLGLDGQIYFGLLEYNKDLQEWGGETVNFYPYLHSGHFIEATFKNWESEFLQMGLLVWFTIFLRQKGSSESKDIDKPNEVDRTPSPDREGAPWPVRKAGIWLKLYKNSLTISLILLFEASLYFTFTEAFMTPILRTGLRVNRYSGWANTSQTRGFGLNHSKTGRANFCLYSPSSCFQFF